MIDDASKKYWSEIKRTGARGKKACHFLGRAKMKQAHYKFDSTFTGSFTSSMQDKFQNIAVVYDKNYFTQNRTIFGSNFMRKVKNKKNTRHKITKAMKAKLRKRSKKFLYGEQIVKVRKTKQKGKRIAYLKE